MSTPDTSYILAVKSCEDCRGAGCSNCGGRGFVATLLDVPGIRRPTGVAEAVVAAVELRGAPQGSMAYFRSRPLKPKDWRERAKMVAPLLGVLEHLDNNREEAAMLGVHAFAGVVHMAKDVLADPEWRALVDEAKTEEIEK